MRRRDFITLVGGATAAWPLAARAQQTAMPVIGFLTSRTPEQAGYLVAALRTGLKEAGYSEGENVVIEYRYAESRYERLPALAQSLVDRQVAVIVAGGTSGPAIAATKTIPIVFTTGFDPVSSGLVGSLNRPGSNVTGATFYSGALSAKQMEFLIALAPKTAVFGLLVNPKGTSFRDTNSRCAIRCSSYRARAACAQREQRERNQCLHRGAGEAFQSRIRCQRGPVLRQPSRITDRIGGAIPAAGGLLPPRFCPGRRADELRCEHHRSLSAGGRLCRPHPQG